MDCPPEGQRPKGQCQARSSAAGQGSGSASALSSVFPPCGERSLPLQAPALTPKLTKERNRSGHRKGEGACFVKEKTLSLKRHHRRPCHPGADCRDWQKFTEAHPLGLGRLLPKTEVT